MQGLLYVALGPCNSDDIPEEPTADNSLDMNSWMETLGLQSVQVSPADTPPIREAVKTIYCLAESHAVRFRVAPGV